MRVVVRLRNTDLSFMTHDNVVEYKEDKFYYYLKYRDGGRSRLIRRNVVLQCILPDPEECMD